MTAAVHSHDRTTCSRSPSPVVTSIAVTCGDPQAQPGGGDRYDIDGLVSRLIHAMVAMQNGRIPADDRLLLRRLLGSALAVAR